MTDKYTSQLNYAGKQFLVGLVIIIFASVAIAFGTEHEGFTNSQSTLNVFLGIFFFLGFYGLWQFSKKVAGFR